MNNWSYRLIGELLRVCGLGVFGEYVWFILVFYIILDGCGSWMGFVIKRRDIYKGIYIIGIKYDFFFIFIGIKEKWYEVFLEFFGNV